MMPRILRRALAGAALAFVAGACGDGGPAGPSYQAPVSVTVESGEVAWRWSVAILSTIKRFGNNSPTYASRSLGYLGLAMYESVVNGDSSHVSLAGQLPGLTLPKPDPALRYEWVLSMNAAVDTLIRLLYPRNDTFQGAIYTDLDTLANAVRVKYIAKLDPDVALRSIRFGIDIGLALYAWSLTDGGHRGFARRFDPTFAFPSGPSYWVPPARGQIVSPYPLHPTWGQNRTFVASNATIAIPPIEPYSTDTSSRYYKMYRAIWAKDPTLTLDEREMAAWWGDDPSETASPPGHSFYITGVAVMTSGASLVKAAEAFARTGLAVADAFIHCWKVKFTYFNERPSSYANRTFGGTFVQFWPEPPFPAFPSGHSTQCAAAATVQAAVFGDPFPFIDRLHVGTRRFDDPRFLDLTYPQRSFPSFMAAAIECGDSRLLGGIHTAQDNDAGRVDGITIGQHVNQLAWRR